MGDRLRLILDLNAVDLDTLKEGFQVLANDFAIDGHERKQTMGASGAGYRYDLTVLPAGSGGNDAGFERNLHVALSRRLPVRLVAERRHPDRG